MSVKLPILDRYDTDPNLIVKGILVEEAGSAGVRAHGQNVDGSCSQALLLQPPLHRQCGVKRSLAIGFLRGRRHHHVTGHTKVD